MSKRALKILLGTVMLWAAAAVSERPSVDTPAAGTAVTIATRTLAETPSTAQQ